LRLAAVAAIGFDSEQRCDLIPAIGRRSERSPLRHPIVEIGEIDVLRRGNPRLGPASGHGIGQRQILSGARIAAIGAGGLLENIDRTFMIAGEREGETEIGCADPSFEIGELFERILATALREAKNNLASAASKLIMET